MQTVVKPNRKVKALRDAIERSSWIPVSEAMPKEGEKVLAINSDSTMMMQIVVNGDFIPVINKEGELTPVTYWRPLPLGPEILES